MAENRIDGKNYTVIPRLNITEELIVDTPTAQGMVWRGPYEDNQETKVGEVVTANNWLMIANKNTFDRPDPQPIGPEDNSLPASPAFATSNLTDIILSGHNYEFIESGWIRRIRVWVPTTGPNYLFNLRLAFTQFGLTQTTTIPLTSLATGVWNEIPVSQQIISPGARASVILETTNSSASTSWNGQWEYTGTTANNPPGDKSWNRNSGHSILRIDKTDQLDADRTADLVALEADTIVTLTQDNDISRFHEYNIQGPGTDMGDYFEYVVVQVNAGANVQSGNVCTVSAVIPTPEPTDFVEIDAYDWTANQPSFATVLGTLSTGGGVNLPGKFNNAFGVDLFFQPAQVSQDFDFMAFSQF